MWNAVGDRKGIDKVLMGKPETQRAHLEELDIGVWIVLKRTFKK
jgi:hypothetical protein